MRYRRSRNIRFGDTSKGARLRAMAKEIDRKSTKVSSAIATIADAVKLAEKFEKEGKAIVSGIDWLRLKSFLMRLNDLYGGNLESNFEESGQFEASLKRFASNPLSPVASGAYYRRKEISESHWKLQDIGKIVAGILEEKPNNAKAKKINKLLESVWNETEKAMHDLQEVERLAK